jgi:hypothetical protein
MAMSVIVVETVVTAAVVVAVATAASQNNSLSRSTLLWRSRGLVVVSLIGVPYEA